ncbi:hypothetical protein K523DRAFT_73216 [Schizophyllum commune Tattone D]|nr:hypothetical protein K523DRAFT_73216 [Schizophyllum commune Tattone D]
MPAPVLLLALWNVERVSVMTRLPDRVFWLPPLNLNICIARRGNSFCIAWKSTMLYSQLLTAHSLSRSGKDTQVVGLRLVYAYPQFFPSNVRRSPRRKLTQRKFSVIAVVPDSISSFCVHLEHPCFTPKLPAFIRACRVIRPITDFPASESITILFSIAAFPASTFHCSIRFFLDRRLPCHQFPVLHATISQTFSARSSSTLHVPRLPYVLPVFPASTSPTFHCSVFVPSCLSIVRWNACNNAWYYVPPRGNGHVARVRDGARVLGRG